MAASSTRGTITAAAPASRVRLIQASLTSGMRTNGTVGDAAKAISMRSAVSMPMAPCSRSMMMKSKPVPAAISAISGLGSDSQQPS